MATLGSKKSDELLNDVFSGYDSVGGTTFTTATTMPLTSEHIASSVTYDLSNSEVTVSSSGRYELTFGCSAVVTTGARTQAQAWLERNGVEMSGTRVALYCRQTNHGATGTAQIFFDLSDGDVIRIRAQRTAGGGTLSSLQNGTRLTLRKL